MPAKAEPVAASSFVARARLLEKLTPPGECLPPQSERNAIKIYVCVRALVFLSGWRGKRNFMYSPMISRIKSDSFPIYGAGDFILWFLDYPIFYYPRSSLSDLLRLHVLYRDGALRNCTLNGTVLLHWQIKVPIFRVSSVCGVSKYTGWFI